MRYRLSLVVPLLIGVTFTGCLDALQDQGRSPEWTPIPVVADGNVTVHFLDVGQGDAILLRFPAGGYVLVDAGPSSAAEEVVADLHALGVDTLWAFVASHGDADHIGGAVEVFNAFHVERVYDPGYPKTTRTYERFLDAVEREGSLYATAEDFASGHALQVDANASVVFLYPETVDESGDPNEEGIVLRVQYGEVSFLLTGDAGFEAERDLVRSGVQLESTILKVGHHGSRYSSGREFLQQVSPEVAVVSVGENDYGHPTYEALYRIREAGATVYRTDEHGTVTVSTDGLSYDVRVERGSP